MSPQIYTYNENGATVESDVFMDRVVWNGSKWCNDIQDASIYLLNVTFNDSGTYQCFFHRILTYDNYEYTTDISKVVELTVVAKGDDFYCRSTTPGPVMGEQIESLGAGFKSKHCKKNDVKK